MDVEQHHVGKALRDELDCRDSLVRLPDHFDRVTELRLDSGAEHRVVLDEENAGPSSRPDDCAAAGTAHRTRARRGIDNWTSAPSPGADRTTADPPKRAIRARID